MTQGVSDGAALAALIRKFRSAAGLTQYELARRAGLSLGSVRDLEQGRTRRPLPGSVRALAGALGLNSTQAGDLERAAISRGLEMQILGPLAAWHDGVAVSLGGPAQRAVLGLLALSPDSLVHRTAIIDVLWPDDPPANAVNLVQAHVSRLRNSLTSGFPPSGIQVLSSDGASYRLQVGARQLDLIRFTTLTAAARAGYSRGEFDGACGLYEQALGLWRGDPLDGVDLLRGHPGVISLDRQRGKAIIAYAAAAAAAGWHARALTPLQELASREPLNELAHAQLMILLAGCGQQAEALAIYHDMRRRLDEELAIPPGQELADAHQRVLRQDITSALAATAGTDQPTDRKPAPAMPRELPPAVPGFTGRSAELEALTTLLDRTGSQNAATLVISVIGGSAGVGKTALAMQWAHQVADRFPDGQLYVNLRGYDPDQPLAAEEVLAGFLTALGIPGPKIPAELRDRIAAFRSVLAGRRVLIVLDNARDAKQVRPLLPGEAGCLVVVTSRDMLAGLIARDGARRVLLDVLPLDDAVTLLRVLIGPRVQDEPEAAARLAALCCRLPLALRVAAELAAARPAMSLAALASELGSQGRLDALKAGGDQATAVREVFSWSCRHLSPGALRTFRLAALHPGTDLSTDAVAALTAASHPEAADALDELARSSLLSRTGPDRYQMHDLLRTYAAELAASRETATGQRQALTRLLDHYLHTARRSAAALFAADAPALADRPDGACGAVAWDEPVARAWLGAERANLMAAAVHASDHGWPGHAVDLSAALFRYLDAEGLLAEALVIHDAAARGAIRAGDRRAEAGAVINLGGAYLRLGRYQDAEQRFQRALALSREAGNRPAELRALLNLGQVCLSLGTYPEAASYGQQALELSRAVGERIGEARALLHLNTIALWQGRYQQAAVGLAQAADAIRANGDLVKLTASLILLGEVEVRQGRYRQARRHLEEGRTIARQIGHALYEADATGTLGFADLRDGRYPQAAQQIQQALAAYRDERAPAAEAEALCNLGELDLRLGRPAQAASGYRQALAIGRRIGRPLRKADASNGLGEAALAQGALEQARTRHLTALTIANEIGSLAQQARAHEGLGNISATAGDAAGARVHWQEALARYTDMGIPDVSRVRAKLASVKVAPPLPDRRTDGSARKMPRRTDGPPPYFGDRVSTLRKAKLPATTDSPAGPTNIRICRCGGSPH